MKITNFKIYPLMIAVSALLALSGCDSTTGIISDSGIGTEIPAPTPDAGTSTVTATPLTVLADGTETATVIVTINDSNSNPITNATVELMQTGSSVISAVTNVGDGTYTFDVTSTTLETVTYTAKADGVTITQTANVTFRAQTEAECLLAAGPNGYGTIVIKGKTWLDRNLGAIQAATSSTDPDAHGDLYQWGRSTEGHQDRTSDTNDTLADTIDNVQNTAWEGKFITTTSDWVDTGVDDNGTLRSQSWSTPYDANQVCPCGYIVPTTQDFIDLNLTASGTRDTFKLTYAGWRQNTDGVIQQVDTRAFFWTSSVNSANNDRTNLYYYTPALETQFDTPKRAHGYSIRCIKP